MTKQAPYEIMVVKCRFDAVGGSIFRNYQKHKKSMFHFVRETSASMRY